MEFYYHSVDKDVLILSADGGLNADNADWFVSELETLVQSGIRKLIVDCKKLRFISSFGVGVLVKLSKKLAEKGVDRHQLGREKFIEEVWKWRGESGSAIINQLKRLGASCDWKRERFTMDEGLSKAVRKVFVQLYDEDLIYRGNYIINWCSRSVN